MSAETTVFLTGGTGYMGRALIPALLARGHEVLVLARPGSERNVPPGARTILGDALVAATFEDSIPSGATVIHLVGTPHPSPAKAFEFRSVDLASIRSVSAAAVRRQASHLIYVSVAHPAPVMRAYIETRMEGERLVEETEIPSTILRPWYVLGSGHRWTYLLVPVYALLRRIPRTEEGALRLGLVTLPQMVAALVRAVEARPVDGIRFVEVSEIRAGTSEKSRLAR